MSAAEELDHASFGHRAGDSNRIDELMESAVRTKEWERPKDAIEFSGLRWRPHLVRPSSARRRALLHIQLTDLIQPFLVARLHAAHGAGWVLHLVVDSGSLHTANFVDSLAGIDVTVHIPNKGGTLGDGRDLLALLGEHAVALPGATRSKLALSAWQRRNEGRKYNRGRRLEGLLAFLFGQVKGLRVVELNFRSATEEIDIVLQTDRDISASWYESRVPFVLVESKNWSDTVGSSDLSSFLVKVQYKRGRCRIGIMCAAGGFSSDARSQELRLSGTAFTMVMIGPEMIKEWIVSEDPTSWLDRCVRRAMLR